MTAARLELREVVVAFGGLRAVDGVSLTIEPGEIVGFIGPNGSGKTTLLDTISGQLVPESGQVLLDGEDLIDHLPEDRAELGLVRSFQDARLFPDLSVEDTLLLAEDARRPVGVFATTFALPAARRAEAAKRDAVAALLDTLGLGRFRHQPISELSTGTRRIVDLAAIIAAQPRLLLLDEPTAGIAQREAEAFGPLLRRLHDLTGATICIVEHDVPLVVGLADRLVVMETGKVVSAGPVADVLRPIRSTQLTGSPRWSVRARRQWRLFNAEPPVVRITALGAALALLIGMLAVIGGSSDHTSRQGIAARGGTSVGVNGLGSASSTASDAASTASAGPGSADGGGSAAGAPGTGDGSQPGNGFAPDGSPLTDSDRGVTSTKIKVVFPYADLGPIGSATGLDPGNEDESTAITAYVNDVNSRGGINGRLIDPEIVKYNPLDDAEMRADCKDWTESQEVFAVVDSYGWHDDHQLCITQEHHTPLISKWTTVTDWTNRGNPYLWWTGPDSVEVLDNLVASSDDVLSKNKFAILTSDRESDKLALQYIEASLARAGLQEAVEPQQLSFTPGVAASQIGPVMLRLQTAGVKVVIPVLSFLQLVTFLQAEHSQGVRYQLLLSDYESSIQALLGLAESQYESELQDTIGPTVFRLGSAENPTGYTPFGQTCSDQYHKQDPTYTQNLEGVGVAMTWCENIYLFAQAAAAAGNNLTRDTFNNAMSRVQGFGGSISPDVTFGPNVRAGPHLYRMVQIHVNDRAHNSCPDLQQDGNPQGSCWLIKSEFVPAAHT